MNAQLFTATLSLTALVCAPAALGAQSRFNVQRSALPAGAAPAEPGAGTSEPRIRKQAASGAPTAASDDTKISVYPVLLWVPSFSATANVPAFPDLPNGPDLPGGSGSTSASLDGAALAGFSLEKSRWRIDADGIWAALGSQRERPLLNVDLDVIYGHVSGGPRIYKDLYLTVGVRRIALKYDIQLGERTEHFVRKPGVWDPLVGLAWHGELGRRLTLHLVGEGGATGVGADVDVSGSVRVDLKMTRHVGLTLGYSALYLDIRDTVGNRPFAVKQTLHGPVIGLGLYF